MTREKFIERAVRAMEDMECLPRGWWGIYKDVRGPSGERVRWVDKKSAWISSLKGADHRAHDSREGALRRARKLYKGAVIYEAANYKASSPKRP